MKKFTTFLLLAGIVFMLNSAQIFAFDDPFSDTSPDLMDSVTYLADKGIIEGYPDGTVRLENDINRAEVTKILVEGNGVTPDLLEYNNCFDDVIDDWYAPYVCYAEEQGWVQGYADGNFKPDQTIIKVEVIKLILVSQDYEIPDETGFLPYDDVVTTQWYGPYVKAAFEKNLYPYPGPHFSPENDMTRGDAFEILFRTLVIDELGIGSYHAVSTDELFNRDKVENVTVSSVVNTITVTWDEYEGSTSRNSYTIFMKQGSDFEEGEIGDIIEPIFIHLSDTKYTFTGLANDTYYFKVGTGYNYEGVESYDDLSDTVSYNLNQ
ncbi:S-layer homology domain-containing protein [Patescibacteria group bacterium]